MTVEQFLELKPCYGEVRIRLLAEQANKSDFTAADILAIPRIPNRDRLWAVLREELLSDLVLHEFACRCAEHALNRFDPRSFANIAVKRAWMHGAATSKELGEAWREARQRSVEAAWGDDTVAIWDTVRSAMLPNARSAARTASWDAVRVAALSNNRHAEWRWQVQELRRMTDA